MSASFSAAWKQLDSLCPVFVSPVLLFPAFSCLGNLATAAGEPWRLAVVGSRLAFDPGFHCVHPVLELPSERTFLWGYKTQKRILHVALFPLSTDVVSTNLSLKNFLISIGKNSILAIERGLNVSLSQNV